MQGVAEADIVAISAVTGAGVPKLVRAVRSALDALPVLPEYQQVSFARHDNLDMHSKKRARCGQTWLALDGLPALP